MLKGGGGEESELGKRGGKTPRSAYKEAKGFCLAGPADQWGPRATQHHTRPEHTPVGRKASRAPMG